MLYDDKWLQLYGWLIDGAKEGIGKKFATAHTTEVTTAAIAHASFNARPSARYFVAASDGVPTWAAAAMVRVLPAYLTDMLIAVFHSNA